MSMQGWSESGYGYALFNGKNDKKVVDFIAKSQGYDDEERDRLSNMDDREAVEEIEEMTGDFCEESVAKFINEQEGISCMCWYMSCAETETEPHIGICTSYPWKFNEKDRELTAEKADEILKKYGEMLGIDEDPEYFDLEYFG